VSTWHRVRRRSAIARKGVDFALQVPRLVVRAGASPSEYLARPPLLANSFPKSGTNLLRQVLHGLPGSRSFGSFIASTPSLTLRERDPARICALVRRIVPGEVVGAHIFHDASIADAAAARGCVHYFIHRDPRDVAVSEAHYLTYMNHWHRLHGYFRHRLGSDAERVLAAITGIDESEHPVGYPDIGRRFARYAGWIGRTDVCAVRYEQLVGGARDATMRAMIDFYRDRTGREVDTERVLARMRSRIAPERSHTFRDGRPGAWREIFDERHHEAFARVAGALHAVRAPEEPEARGAPATSGDQRNDHGHDRGAPPDPGIRGQ